MIIQGNISVEGVVAKKYLKIIIGKNLIMHAIILRVVIEWVMDRITQFIVEENVKH